MLPAASAEVVEGTWGKHRADAWRLTRLAVNDAILALDGPGPPSGLRVRIGNVVG